MNKLLTACIAILALTLTACGASSGRVALPATAVPRRDALTSIPVQSAPAIDGSDGDLAWQVAPARAFDVKTDGVKPFQVTLKSVYDQEHLYLLVQYPDSTMEIDRSPWDYDPAQKAWIRLDDSLGDEDEFGFYWSVNVPEFPTKGCTPLCHDLPDGRQKMYTPDGSWIDIWQWNAARSNPMGWGRDLMLTSFPDAEENGLGGFVPDEGSMGETSGHLDNLQTIDGLDVPAYWKPYSGAGGVSVGDRLFILQSEIDAGIVKKIVGVGPDGALIDETGATVPFTGRIPGRILSAPSGPSWNDITARGQWYRGVWTVELKRKLNTGHKDDIAFTDLSQPYYFGIYFKTRQTGEQAREQMPLGKLVFSR